MRVLIQDGSSCILLHRYIERDGDTEIGWWTGLADEYKDGWKTDH